jgi:hypothetical protein
MANIQQLTSDYYKNLGIEYYLMITPSKSSIYPEYLDSWSSYQLMKSPLDITTEYLKENTNVNIIELKPTLINHRFEGVYYKQDSHWNELGAYYGYLEILNHLNEKSGVLSSSLAPIKVEFQSKTKKSSELDLLRMLGTTEHEIGEAFIGFNFTNKATSISNSQVINNIKQIDNQTKDGKFNIYQYENKSIETGDVLIYGDSFLSTGKKLPNLLAENFKLTSGLTNNTYPRSDIDTIINPDIVLQEVTERHINPKMLRYPKLPFDKRNINELSLPVMDNASSNESSNLNNFAVETNNGENTDSVNTLKAKTGEPLTLTGWAVDSLAQKPAGDLFLIIGDKAISCYWDRINKPKIVKYYNQPAVSSCGYTVTIPAELLTNIEEIEFAVISADHTYKYPNIKYNINWE